MHRLTGIMCTVRPEIFIRVKTGVTKCKCLKLVIEKYKLIDYYFKYWKKMFCLKYMVVRTLMDSSLWSFKQFYNGLESYLRTSNTTLHEKSYLMFHHALNIS